MIVDLLRWAKETAIDGAAGLNAQLASIPRDGGEPAPAAVTIYNPLDHPWVGKDTIPRELQVDENGDPRRIVVLSLHPDPEGFVTHALQEFEEADPTIIPLIGVFTVRKIEKQGDSTTIATQLRDARQVIRALMRTFALKFENAHTVYTRNDCDISLPSRPGFTLNSQFVEVTADHVTDTLIMPFRVLDRWALGIT